ncbi:beta-lactamase family protein [bacterium]|nr:beta-lactamase family protein [bacterium]
MSQSKAKSELQGRIDEALRRSRVPALAVAVIQQDSIETAVAGLRRKGGKDPVTSEDLWHLGSNTKAMTATLAGLQVQAGRLSWESRPLDLWPELRGRISPAFEEITLRQLLRHRAGIPAFTSGSEFMGLPAFEGDSRARRLAFSEYVLCHKPGGRPGDYLYSNAGYSIAAAMLEQAADEDFESLLAAQVMQPLGISGHWGWPGLVEGQPWGHGAGLLGLVENDPHGEYRLEDFVAPAGDMSMSIGNYALFVQAHLRGLTGLAPLSGSTTEGVTSGMNTALIQDLHIPEGEYSCGWLEQPLSGGVQSAHEGSAGTFHAITVIRPAQQIAVVAICNAGGEKAAGSLRSLVMELLSQEL